LVPLTVTRYRATGTPYEAFSPLTDVATSETGQMTFESDCFDWVDNVDVVVVVAGGVESPPFLK
jgi:hypothetical protein